MNRKPSFSVPLQAACIVGLVLLAYFPALDGGFVWDDPSHVSENILLRDIGGLWKIWFEPGAWLQYYPLVLTSFWVQYHVWGLNPFFYHLVNILLHAANALLLWRILIRLRIPGSWPAALVFALHPVHVESVAWISEHKNCLSGCFYLAALLCFLRWEPSGRRPPDSDMTSVPSFPGTGPFTIHTWYLLSLLLYFCAVLAKTITCSLPAVILLILWWKKKRLRLRDIRPLIPMFTFGVVLGTGTIWMEKFIAGAGGVEWSYSLADRCLIAGRALWFYAGKLAWPSNLSFMYPRWHIDSAIWWQYLFPLTAVSLPVLLWLFRNRLGNGPLTAVLIFGGTLFPALGFIDVYPMRFTFVADHFQYLASIGLIVACVSGTRIMAGGAEGTADNWMKAHTAVLAAILVMLAALTWHSGHRFRDSETLWRDTLAKNPESWMAHNNLGRDLAASGRSDEARRHYEKALQIKPDLAEGYNNLGNLMQGRGNLEGAIANYTRAVSIKPGRAALHYNLANALMAAGNTTMAIRHYEKALLSDPNNALIHNNLGLARVRTGSPKGALEHFREAARLDPDLVEARTNISIMVRRFRHPAAGPAAPPADE